jgi:hypothetical protein
MDEHEEYEQIPWSQLSGGPAGGRWRILYLIAAALGTLVLAVLVARAFLSSPGETVAPADTLIEEEVEGGASTSSTGAESSPLGLLYREADLMAFAASPQERAAVTRAEWFVTDYYTADLEPSGSADVRAALPAGSAVPDLPQDAAASLSYVEWARAFRVEEVGDGIFRVGVLYRALGAPPDRGFYRLPVRAVEVTVQVGENGGSVVLDLPTPVPLPAGPEPQAWPEESQEPPPRVADAALALVAGWGTEPRVVSAQQAEDGWRVVLTLADEVGNRWPASVFVEAGEGPGG